MEKRPPRVSAGAERNAENKDAGASGAEGWGLIQLLWEALGTEQDVGEERDEQVAAVKASAVHLVGEGSAQATKLRTEQEFQGSDREPERASAAVREPEKFLLRQQILRLTFIWAPDSSDGRLAMYLAIISAY